MNNNIEKEEKKLKILILIILILIILISSFMIYIIFNSKINLKDNIKSNNYVSYMDYDEINDISESYFLVSKNKNQLIIDKDNKVIKELNNTNYKNLKYINEYFILSNDTNSIVINKLGDIILECNGIINNYNDLITNKTYFVVYDKLNLSIYDNNFNILKTLQINNYKNDIYFINDEIYINNNIYDNNFNKIDEYKNLINLSNYIIIENNKYNIINLKTNEILEYNDMEYINEHYIFNNDDNTFILNKDGNIIDNLSKVKFDNYYIDYESCKSGGILKDKYDNIVYNECSKDFDLSNILNGVIIVTTNNEIINKKVVFHDKIIESNDAKFIGDYILVYQNDIYNIYDLKGNEINIKDSINTFGKIFDNYYINNKIYDNTLTNVIKEYDNIYEYENNVFKISIDGTTGLYYNDNWLIDLNKFWDITKINDYYILNNIDGYTVIKFNELKKIDIKIKDLYNNININKINNIQNKKDETLLKKYIYILNKNINLKDYNDKFLNLFEIISNNKTNLKENILLNSLNKLSFINTNDFLESNALGLYSYKDNKVYYSNKEDIDKLNHVLYHELIHFIDYNINNYKYSIDFYKCDNDYYIIDEYKNLENKDNCKYYKSVNTDFFSEGETEKINIKYYKDYKDTTYINYIRILNILDYIYKEDVINNIYFNENTNYEFYKLLKKDINIEDYINMIEIFNNVDNLDNNNDLIKASDYLIKLYEIKNNKKWYLDDIFKSLISNLLPYDLSNYKEYNEYILDKKSIQKNIMEEYIKKNNLTHIESTNDLKMFLINNQYYYYLELDNKYWLIKYDFNNNKILEFKETN